MGGELRVASARRQVAGCGESIASLGEWPGGELRVASGGGRMTAAEGPSRCSDSRFEEPLGKRHRSDALTGA